jgi:hypothetical protein
MKQVFHNKGNRAGERWNNQQEFDEFWEFDGTKLQAFPLTAELDATTATLLDRLVTELGSATPASIAATGIPNLVHLKQAERDYHDLRAQMVAAQERLDWEVYRRYELVDEDLTQGPGVL